MRIIELKEELESKPASQYWEELGRESVGHRSCEHPINRLSGVEHPINRLKGNEHPLNRLNGIEHPVNRLNGIDISDKQSTHSLQIALMQKTF